ncbi:HBR437Wp [Eremothecium sinecaudum]|uniref:HBR437Wp n=1 Tax=Eremothecium sinecaudum TaxID=45286 RepID=A0A109UXG8_9SACH|nr:HBR437Wp [Eremothecium sinecaudum]AMD19338.1 HBR437Wp [Eremothecium sinecaudum]
MSKPFQGLTFCPTGVADDVYQVISKKVVKLGGCFSRDLTSQVQVLVVGSRRTVKYQYVVANRADIVFINAEAINKVYDTWLAGEDVAEGLGRNEYQRDRILKMLRERFQLGPFMGFYVFIGRVKGDKVSVNELQQLCEMGQAYRCLTNHFIKDTECKAKSVFVTDCGEGARATVAREQGVPILHPKWIMDCVKRGAMMEFEFYALDTCADRAWDEIGADACNCWDQLERGSQPLSLEEKSKEEKEDGERVVRLNSRARQNGSKLWASTVSKAENAANQEKVQVYYQNSDEEEDALGSSQVLNLFEGHCFCLFGFSTKRHRILEDVINLHKGELVAYQDNVSAKHNVFYLCPSDFPVEELPADIDWVTEFYIERCLHYKDLMDPDPWCRPFFSKFFLKPSKQLLRNHDTLSVHITGFQGVELLHMNKILGHLENMGLKSARSLNQSTDILIVNLSQLNSIPEDHTLRKNQYAPMFIRQKEQNQIFRNSMKRKIEFINKHSIPLVTPGFLLELFRRALQAKSDGLSSAKIYLNDINWCIICPRGSKQIYSMEIEVSSTKTLPVSTHINLKSESLEAMMHINKTHTSPDLEAVKLLSNSIPAPRNFEPLVNKQPRLSPPSELSPQVSPAKEEVIAPITKRRKLHTTPPVQRTSSWGNLMTEDAKQVATDLESERSHEPDVTSTEQTGDRYSDSVMHTQVTYGEINNRKQLLPPPPRRLTRQSYKEQI